MKSGAQTIDDASRITLYLDGALSRARMCQSLEGQLRNPAPMEGGNL